MDTQQRIQRDWENVPPMAMVPMRKGFSYSSLVKYVSEQAPDKELVCLVQWGWTTSQEQALHQIQLLYEFADDPELVMMRFLAPVLGQEQLIIRASFMRKTVSEVEVSNLYDLVERLSQLATKQGLHTKTLE